MIGSEATTVIALIVILSFAIDRIVTGLLFLLSFNKSWCARLPEPATVEPGPARVAAAKKYKLIYSLLAAFLAIVIVAGFANVRVLSTLGVTPHEWPFLKGRFLGEALVTLLGYAFVITDVLITGLILTAGADRVAQLMKWLGGQGGSLEKSEPKPIEVTGMLVLEERARNLPNEASQKDWVGESLPAADAAIKEPQPVGPPSKD
jgi:hypothetical protein